MSVERAIVLLILVIIALIVIAFGLDVRPPMTWTLAGINTAGILTTHATVTRPTNGDWEYVIWAIGTGLLRT